jgi:prepilin-type N-terminal cleavage/methylation domain-containing protein
MRKTLARGFTLVELLIVIALLGVIATIVIAAINPIEQANRASDSGMKSDASQLLSAIQRYYATHNSYPWNSCTGDACTPPYDSPEDEVPFTMADNTDVGLCSVTGAGCKNAVGGPLIAALELQNAFLSKSWIGASDDGGTSRANALMVGKAQGASASVYICWIPKSNSNRQNLISSGATSNKMVDTTGSFDAGSGIPAESTACTAPSGTGQDWITGVCSECVPE